MTRMPIDAPMGEDVQCFPAMSIFSFSHEGHTRFQVQKRRSSSVSKNEHLQKRRCSWRRGLRACARREHESNRKVS